MSELTDYIEKELIQLDYGSEMIGINEPNTAQLFILKGLIDARLFNLQSVGEMDLPESFTKMVDDNFWDLI